MDVECRLEELATLKPGWLDGRGAALDPAALKTLAQDFDRYYDPELPLPHLYPTAEGGIQAEWTLGDWEVSLEIDLPGKAAQYQALHTLTQQSEDLQLQLAGGEDTWAKLNTALRSLLGTQA